MCFTATYWLLFELRSSENSCTDQHKTTTTLIPIQQKATLIAENVARLSTSVYLENLWSSEGENSTRGSIFVNAHTHTH